MATDQRPRHRAVRFGGTEIPGNLFLAPLAGYTDAAFRSVCVEHGADFTYTEMVSAEGLARSGRGSLRLLGRAENEKQLGVQIFASTAASAAAAASRIIPWDPTLLDLNCGCSVPKILRSGCGAALLRAPQRIGEMVRAITETTGIRVSVKLRLGWDASEITYLDAARSAVEAGAAMIALHPRTRSQGFGGTADWSHITRLCAETDAPVIGSGDLFSAEDGVEMLRATGCEGIMFARGAIGNPFIFDRARRLMSGQPAPKPSLCLRLQTALEHLRRAEGHKGELVACREMRKHLPAYVRGVPGAAAIRRQAATLSRVQEFEELVRTSLNPASPSGNRGCAHRDSSL